ncbi:ParA family protein [Coleofasciculus sp. F4-SAH-05]|uniref:ParA family protein n=1 Tax=Coleofasciculus sp. F4-SAH-05 TaxID=3069525 RepID=UPI0032F5076D
MIPSDIRLYTWVDVEEVLLRMRKQNNWHQSLVWARGYWDGLTLGIRPGCQDEVKEWLSQVYDPRFRGDSDPNMGDGSIVLESISGNQRLLPVFFEETEEEPATPRLKPSLSRPGVLWQPTDSQFPEVFPSDFPPVVAFHSFKGGVGRTTHTLALARVLATKQQKVLLVDGDLEAPGISWVFEHRLPNPPISFADLIALAHGDPSTKAENAVQLVADRLQSALIDGIYILPSFRSHTGFTSLAIRPEHLIEGSKNPFLLTQILASLGKAIGVDVVLIDLRAGLSELATGLILDPRVYRVFVTTLSGQSISGTVQLIKLVAERAMSQREEDPLPALIFTQVPEDERLKNLVLEPEKILLEAAQPFLAEDRELLQVTTGFADSLLVLPPNWEDVMMLLQRSGILEAVHPLVEWLPHHHSEPIEESPSDLKSKREKLSNTAEKLVYAENAEAEDFLATTPLRRLASDHRRQVPITVVVGAKGSGKTYTFLQMIRRKNWHVFAQDACASDVEMNAVICPILASENLEDSAKRLVKQVQESASLELGFKNPQDSLTMRDHIRDGYQLALHEGQWRERWLDVIAWGVGFQPQQDGAGRALATHLVESHQRLVVVIDGLEDLFQNFTSNEAQQTALRALLQEVPEWLGQQPNRPLGILIFVRRDIVLAAVRQNAAQMMARYEPYALKWNREEALRLVAWVTQQADIQLKIEQLHTMSEEELTQALVPLWGKKLGKERSREARSARYVIAALSDFNGQIQSRDLVRLLHLAATDSVNDDYWQDRILVPTAIKRALPGCSSQKIDEIEKENTALKDIFNKLRQLEKDKKKNPFTRVETELSLTEIKTLEDNGVIIRDADEYYMSEIFRWGLDFSQLAGRSKVLALERRARQGY